MLAISEDLSLLSRWRYNTSDVRNDASEIACRPTPVRVAQDGVWRFASCSAGPSPYRQGGAERAGETGDIGMPSLGIGCTRVSHGKADRSRGRGDPRSPGLWGRDVRRQGEGHDASA
jgi:hypothetical protein